MQKNCFELNLIELRLNGLNQRSCIEVTYWPGLMLVCSSRNFVMEKFQILNSNKAIQNS